MSINREMYEVWVSEGTGEPRTLRFKLREDALRYIDQYAGAGSLALRNPDGTWHTWHEADAVVRNRRRVQRIPVDGECFLDPAPGRRGTHPALRCSLTNASEGGLALELPAEAELHARDPVWLSIAEGAIEVPARVAWRDGRRTGLQLYFADGEVYERFRRWLKQREP